MDQCKCLRNFFTLFSPLEEIVDFEFDLYTGKYYPVLFLNDYWNLLADYYPVNNTFEFVFGLVEERESSIGVVSQEFKSHRDVDADSTVEMANVHFAEPSSVVVRKPDGRRG